MSKLTESVMSNAPPFLRGDERLVAAVGVTPLGWDAQNMGNMARPIGGALGGAMIRGGANKLLGTRKREKESADRLAGGLASKSSATTGWSVLALTDARLLLLSTRSHRMSRPVPDEVVADWERAKVQDLTVESRRLSRSVTLRFSDSSFATFDVVKAQAADLDLIQAQINGLGD